MSPGLHISGVAGGFISVVAFQTALQNRLNAGFDATVTGELIGVTEELSIIIPVTRTVTWQAEFEGGVEPRLIHVAGNGEFIITDGAVITQNADGWAVQSGWSDGTMATPANVTITGNARLVNEGISSWGNVTISGNAEITVGNHNALSLSGFEASTINISGGTITVGDASAIRFLNNLKTVNITGGTIINNSSLATIDIGGFSNTLIVTGGTATNNGTGVEIAVPASNSIAIEYTGTFPATFNAGVSTALNVLPVGATAIWENQGGISGIVYTIGNPLAGGRSGFIAVPGVTVTPAVTHTAPTITTQPTSQTVTAGQNATFTAAADGNPAPTLQWQVSTDDGANWSNVAGETNATLTLNAVTVAMDGNQYRMVATGSVHLGSGGLIDLQNGFRIGLPGPPVPPGHFYVGAVGGESATVPFTALPTDLSELTLSGMWGSAFVRSDGAGGVIARFTDGTSAHLTPTGAGLQHLLYP